MYELKSLRNYEHKLPMSSLKKQHDYNAHSLKKTKSTHKTINKPNYSIKNSSTSMYRQNIDKVQIHDDLERKNPSFVSKISARNSPQSNVNSIQAYPNNLNKYMSSSVFQKMGQSIVSTTKKKPLENIFVHSNSNQENNILKSLAYGNTPLKQTSGNDRLVLNGSNKMYLKPSESEPQAPLDLKLTINESLIEKLIYYWSDFIDLEIVCLIMF